MIGLPPNPTTRPASCISRQIGLARYAVEYRPTYLASMACIGMVEQTVTPTKSRRPSRARQLTSDRSVEGAASFRLADTAERRLSFRCGETRQRLISRATRHLPERPHNLPPRSVPTLHGLLSRAADVQQASTLARNSKRRSSISTGYASPWPLQKMSPRTPFRTISRESTMLN